MPKQKITKEMITAAAFDLARAEGMDSLTVKSISEKLNCSVQPIYFNFENMDSLRYEIGEKAREFAHLFAAKHIDENDLFRTTGQAYVKLAKEEPNIFKMFILHQRKGISTLTDLYSTETDPCIAEKISCQLNITQEAAKQLHLNMLIYTIGLGAIFSVTQPGITAEEIFSQQETAYNAFLKQALENNKSKE